VNPLENLSAPEGWFLREYPGDLFGQPVEQTDAAGVLHLRLSAYAQGVEHVGDVGIADSEPLKAC
jgi:hypothetical protein